MTLRLTLGDASDEASRSWLLRADDATTVAELADVLQTDPWYVAPAADAATSLAAAGVLNGVALPANPRAVSAPGTPRLEIVGGPFAGETVPLQPGQPLRLGSAAGLEIVIADPFLAAHHVTLGLDPLQTPEGRPAPMTLTVIPIDTTQPLLVNGEAVTGEQRLVPADLLQLGSVVLRLGLAPASDADLSPDRVGMRGFNRPSRIAPAKSAPVLQLPGDRPEEQDRSPLPWLSAVIPVVLGVTMAVLFQRPVMLLMAAASPIMVIGSFLTNAKLAKRKGERTQVQWADEVKEGARKVASLVRSQRLDSWYRNPDPVLVRDIATVPLARLWERRKGDADALQARVGVGEVDLDVRFEGGSQKERSARRVGVAPAPVFADLQRGVVGVAGPMDAARSVVRSMLVSLATLRSPRDLQIVVLCDDADREQWAWAQWLPHAQGGDGVVSLFGNTDDTRRERLRELTALLGSRIRATGDRGGSFEQDVLVLVDGARRYRTLPGMVPLLDKGANYGIRIVAIDSDRSRLPEEAATVVAIDGADHSIARVESMSDYYASVLVDGVSLTAAEQVARSLCSVEHVSGVGDEGMLPSSVRFAELLGIDLDDVEALAGRWRANPRRTFVVVGANADGEFAFDLASDGPHALVAGTTGSGKSEFLQTLVISLALANRPDALNFVLVDYKGGSAFADCERLPHTVGMVTNLDARETERALASLDAELKRRERVLRELGAKDIDSAWAKDPEAAGRLGLARLMIVIDEFAELKTELPEFINGLVRIARVGRSLGVNLVLATQRPSGVVTPEMQSNINLRIALRVTDRADSTDVLGSPEAALISPGTPGRGFVRAGQGAEPAPFQTARVASLRQGVQRVTRVLPPKAPIEWNGLGLPPRFPASQAASTKTDHDDTDLRALVNLVSATTQQLGIERNPSPWLLPLPSLLTLDRFTNEEVPADALVLGLEDVPTEQKQRTRTWNVVDDSHLLFMGGALSGRTSALRTLLAQAVQRFSPADLHLYIADYGNGALLPLADAPHCGAVVTPLDQERFPRLIGRLLEELSRRQSLLSQAAVGNIAEQRRVASPAEALPYAMVVIDGWERLASSLNPDQLVAFRDQFMRVLREGPAVGIRVLLTGDRAITGDKVASFIDTQYVLPMRDVNDYRAAGILIREIPGDLPPGRALVGAQGAELQLAVISRDTSGEAQTAAFRSIVEHVRDHFDEFPELGELPRPFRVDPLPSYIALSAAHRLPLAPGCHAPLPTVGVGGDELSRVTIDWSGEQGFVVAGARGTGRSSALAAVAHQLAWAEHPVLVVASKPSVLTEVAEGHGLTVVTDPQTDAGTLLGIVDAVVAGRQGRIVVIVDDAEGLKQTPLEMAISGIAAGASFCVAVESESASSVFGGALAVARKARFGLVLAPTNAMIGTTLFGTQIPRFMLGAQTPGGAVLHRDGAWQAVRVPDVRQ